VCTYDPNKVQTATNSFHLSSAFNTVLADLSALNTTVNAVNLSLTTSINGVQSQLNSNVTSLIDQMNANTTAVLAAIAAINTTSSVNLTPVLDNQVVMMAYLAQINSTTESTYTYMTTTLATNVNSILSAIGVMNATVNRIETNTQNINSTVNQILQNQNDQVFMSVYSG
jgi:outer membrane murein-binding lipoprotein Lpp